MNTNNCKWSYKEHALAIKKIYPECNKQLQNELKDYIQLMRENRFDDFDEHLLLQSICQYYYQVSIIYADYVYIEDGQYNLRRSAIRQ